MPPCTCSIRAFELFVKNLSGLTLRSSLPRPCVSSDQTRRRFGTIPRLRTIEPAAATRINDDFVPFESGVPEGEPLSKGVAQYGTAKEHRIAAQVDKEDPDDEWHAEIEIVAPWPRETKSSSTTDLEVVEHERGDIGNVPLERFEDHMLRPDNGTISTEGALLHELDAEHDSVDTAMQVPLLPAESTIEPSSAQQRSRAENRQGRKLRRLQAGTYRQEAERRSEQRLAHSQLSTVLSNIEAMEGATIGDVGARQGGDVAKATKSESEAEGKKKSHENSAIQLLPKREVGKRPKAEAVVRNVTTGKPHREGWQIQKEALKSKFGEQGWQPRKRLSPDTLDGIRALHSSDPGSYTTQTLAEHFKVTPEAIRRILKSKWRPNAEEAEKRLERWEKRGEQKWTAMAAQGTRPPAKWRAKGIRTPQAEKLRPSRRRKEEYVGWEDRPGANKRPSLSERIL